MDNERDTIIRRAYAEASLAAREKGLSGLRAMNAVLAATAKVASRILGQTISMEDVEHVIHRAS